MTYLLDNLFAIEVPVDSKNIIHHDNGYIGYINKDGTGMTVPLSNRMLGSVTHDDVDFDSAGILGITPPKLYMLLRDRKILFDKPKRIIIIQI